MAAAAIIAPLALPLFKEGFRALYGYIRKKVVHVQDTMPDASGQEKFDKVYDFTSTLAELLFTHGLMEGRLDSSLVAQLVQTGYETARNDGLLPGGPLTVASSGSPVQAIVITGQFTVKPVQSSTTPPTGG